MPNGEVGTSSFFDASYDGVGSPDVALASLQVGLGELTDGAVAGQSWRQQPGPYVGWQIDPQIEFHFCEEVELRSIRLHVDAPVGQDGGVAAPAEVRVRIGEALGVHPINVAHEGPVEIVLPVANLRGLSVEISLVRANSWIMLSEVEFEGDRVDPTSSETCKLPGAGWLPGDVGADWGAYQRIGESVVYHDDLGTDLSRFRDFQRSMDEAQSLREEQGTAIEDFVPYAVARAATTGELWPNAIVPYQIDAVFTPNEVSQILEAIAQWEDRTVVDFRACSTYPGGTCPDTHLEIVLTEGGHRAESPNLGHTSRLFINRETGFCVEGTENCSVRHIAHELGHSLGLMHEHQRWDREDKVRCLAYPDCESERVRGWSVWGDYDYHSIMHYAATTKAGVETLLPLPNGDPEGFFWDLGTSGFNPDRREPSKVDVASVNARYAPLVAGSFYAYGNDPSFELVHGITNEHHSRSIRWGSQFSGVDRSRQIGLVDIDGDGRDDLVAFVNAPGTTDDGDVYVARARGGAQSCDEPWNQMSLFGIFVPEPTTGFCGPEKWLDDFCRDGDSCDVGDFDGDGSGDVISFRLDGTVVVADSRSRLLCALTFGGCDHFESVSVWHSQLGHPDWGDEYRVGDVDDDGDDDVVVLKRRSIGIAQGWILEARVSLSEGASFDDGNSPPALWAELPNADTALVGDLTGEGAADLMEVNDGDLLLHVSTGVGFTYESVWGENFCSWGHCALADMNGDGLEDVVNFAPTDYCSEYYDEAVLAFGPWYNPIPVVKPRGCAVHPLTRVRVALSAGVGFDPPVEGDGAGFGSGWSRTSHEMDCRAIDAPNALGVPCLLGDVDGDGSADIVDPISRWNDQTTWNSQPDLGRRAGDVYVSINTGIWKPYESAVPTSGPAPPPQWTQATTWSVVNVVATRDAVFAVQEGTTNAYRHLGGTSWKKTSNAAIDYEATDDDLFKLLSSGSAARRTGDLGWGGLGGGFTDLIGGVSGLFGERFVDSGDDVGNWRLMARDCFCGGIQRSGWFDIGPAVDEVAVGGLTFPDYQPTLYRRTASGVWSFNFDALTWHQIGGPAGRIYAGGDKLYATNPSNGDLYAYDREDGSWSFISTANHSYAVSPQTGNLVALNESKDKLWLYVGTGKEWNWKVVGGPADEVWVAGGSIWATDLGSGELWQLRIE